MKLLILVRHGNYENDLAVLGGVLSNEGRENVEKLADNLYKFLEGGDISIISSTAGRAIQTAEIIARKFSLSFEKNEILWSEEKRRVDCDGLWELLSSNASEKILFVTHYEYLENFPWYFDRKVSKRFQSQLWGVATIDYAESLILDVEKGILRIINHLKETAFHA